MYEGVYTHTYITSHTHVHTLIKRERDSERECVCV